MARPRRTALPGAPPTDYILNREASIRVLLVDALDLLRRDPTIAALPLEEALRRAEFALELQEEGPLYRGRRTLARAAVSVTHHGATPAGVAAAVARGYALPVTRDQAEQARSAIRAARWRAARIAKRAA